ncbi:aminotransferase class V-fold PLP-dependent enzyme [Lentzea tibetensis]|uniref:Aminotransferase class V-fold PLP-dependent enzyme n=1 Tax=Lentzea tibetensis TaxID=2591470 RepID=A0A563EN60_9PSEU|nr:aminotransferase class V-fold PLP-dependent enzyme [Lentzea tibetensis]TWP48812.1 aminotransferase class V-fold PLP-dependent enzyme [Lentzea tibetensis]
MTAAVFRKHFPALEQRVHLASCSIGARSSDLDDALLRMADDLSGNAWESFEREVLLARQGFAKLVGADEDQIALLPNASTGAYQAASTMEFGKRWKVVTTPVEFPSIAHVWLAQQPRGAEVVFTAEPEDYERFVDRRTRLVSVPLVSYQHGRRLPVERAVHAAEQVGAQVFVDAYQAVGVMPVDVSELDCDFLVAGASKYLPGLPGLAFLYVRDPELTDRVPQLTGWFGRVNPFAFDPTTLDFPGTASRFETGTPPVPACYAANAALGLIGALDLAEVRMHVLQLTELAASRLTGQGEQVHALPPERRGAHIGLVDPDPAALARGLASRDVTVSPRGDLVRISFHYYNNEEDVAALCDALDDVRSGR